MAFERSIYDDWQDKPGEALFTDITQNTILTTGSELDFSAEGLDWQGGTEVENLSKPINSWYSLDDDYLQSIDRIEGKNKFIEGIKVSVQRPFVTGDLLNSDIEILNQTKPLLCLGWWLVRDGQKIENSLGCANLVLDLPVEQTVQALYPKPVLGPSFSAAQTMLLGSAAFLALSVSLF